MTIFNDLEHLLQKKTLRVDYKPFVYEVLHHVFIGLDRTKDKIQYKNRRYRLKVVETKNLAVITRFHWRKRDS